MNELRSGASEGEGADDRPSFKEYLAAKFPEMKPIRSAPTLFRINGCGLGIYGRREADAETGTYVTTQCLSLIFIPVLAVTAYRVLDAPNGRGWVFLGRVPLSGMAKGWNQMLLSAAVLVAALVGYNAYANSPEVKARARLAEARAAEAQGSLSEAARAYADLAGGPCRQEGAQGLSGLLAKQVPQGSLADGLGVVQVALGSSYAQGLFRDDTSDKLLEWVLARCEAEPRQAWNALQGLAAVAPENAAEAREPVLEALVAQEPGDVKAVSELALILEAREDRERLEALLLPLRDRLGKSEGARILGQLLADQGDLEGAHALLLPYVQGRLDALHKAEQAFGYAFKRAQEGLLQGLRDGKGPREFYARYDRATDDDEKDALVGDYLRQRLQDHPAIQQARAALEEAGRVVPVALELGMVKLQRARDLPDPAARTQELEAAEQVFLAIEGSAGASAVYKLNMGKVSFWLGKEQRGRQLLNELLEESERDAQTLLSVASVLREVGLVDEALPLAAESYEAASEEQADTRDGAAHLAAILSDDPEEKIAWIKKANYEESPQLKLTLHQTQAHLARQQGNREEAAKQLRLALEVTKQLDDSASSLNNSGLIYGDLYAMNGRRQDLEQQLDLLQRAERLEPGDPIVMDNVASVLLTRAGLDLTGEELQLERLGLAGGVSLLPYLYADAEGEQAVLQALRDQEDLQQSLQRLQRLQVLSPKSPGTYGALMGTHLLLLDGPQPLEDLLRGVEAAGLDPEPLREQTRQALARAASPEDLKAQATEVAHLQQVLERARATERPQAVALALALLAGARLAVYSLGQDPDVTTALAEAQEAHQTHPSEGTRRMLVWALEVEAMQRLAAELPALAGIRQRTRRWMDPDTVLEAVLAFGDEALRARLVADPGVQRAVELVSSHCRAFPGRAGPGSWALLQALDPDAGAALAAELKQRRDWRLRLELHARLSPLSEGAVWDRAFAAKLDGDEEAARTVLVEAGQQGAPLPWEP